ncbi:MAG: alpha/beta hydrolase [Actinomycetota bacterium]|nr:alpha/beta hydrolase [Actinomycetota bacterium]
MAKRKGLLALAGATAATAAAIAAQRAAINRRRRNDPEASTEFGSRRGERTRTLDLPDGARIFVEEVGPDSKRGAIFIHGSVLRTDVWHYQMEGLGEHRLVFADLRGHGQSTPKGSAAYEIDTLADDLLAVIDDAGLEETVIVGHSVGGMVGLTLCRNRPDLLGDRVKGLVLVNSTYGPVTETLIGSGVIGRIERVTRRPFDALGKQHQRIEQLRKLIRPSDAIFWGVALGAFGPKASPAHIDFAYTMLSETPIEVIFDLVRSYRGFDMTDHLDEITVPTLVIGGDHDRITLPKASRYLAEHLPKSDLHVFPDTGHMSMLERHEEFNELVTNFLDDTLGATRKRGRITTKT